MSDPKVNDQVVACLAKWLAMAKRGEIICVGVVGCADATSVGTDLAGQDGLEFAMNFGVDYLKGQIGAAFAQAQQQRSAIVTARPHIVMPGRH